MSFSKHDTFPRAKLKRLLGFDDCLSGCDFFNAAQTCGNKTWDGCMMQNNTMTIIAFRKMCRRQYILTVRTPFDLNGRFLPPSRFRDAGYEPESFESRSYGIGH